MFQHSVFHSFFAHISNKGWQRAADMASLAAVLSVFDLACRTSLLSLRQLLVFFHFCSKCSIWVKSCQKVEKRRWRGKSKKMRTQKMHMFSHLITFTYLIFRKKKEKWSERNIPVDLLCPQGGRPLILWMTNGSSSHAGWIYDLQFLLSNPALHIQEKMLEIWVALTRENFKLECISASFLIKMQNPGVE